MIQALARDSTVTKFSAATEVGLALLWQREMLLGFSGGITLTKPSTKTAPLTADKYLWRLC